MNKPNSNKNHVTSIICDVQHLLDLGVLYVFYKYKSWCISVGKLALSPDDIFLKADVAKGLAGFSAIFLDALDAMKITHEEDVEELDKRIEDIRKRFSENVLTFDDVSEMVLNGCTDDMYMLLHNEGEELINTSETFRGWVLNNLHIYINKFVSASLFISNINQHVYIHINKKHDNKYGMILGLIKDTLKKEHDITLNIINTVSLLDININSNELVFITHECDNLKEIMSHVSLVVSVRVITTVSVLVPIRFKNYTTKIDTTSLPNIVGLYYL